MECDKHYPIFFISLHLCKGVQIWKELMENNLILIIDDTISRHQIIREWTHFYWDVSREKVKSAYNYEEGIVLLNTYQLSARHLFLDHDFNDIMHDPQEDRELTGSDIAKYMVEMRFKIPTTIISINPVGATNIVNILSDAKIPCQYKPIYQFQFERGETEEEL